MFAKIAGGSVVTKLLATWFVVFSIIGCGVVVTARWVVVTGDDYCLLVVLLLITIVVGRLLVEGDDEAMAAVEATDDDGEELPIVVGACVVCLVFGMSESTTPIGPSRSISDSGQVNSSGWME